ncbi:hypothetical protein CRU92_01890 [Arcobacter sp. FW59]|nr:hypothetical protein CRU92_01890 [Arcobacter sp. FW59]
MIVINSSDFIKKPSYITQPTDITFVEDAKKNVTKSVVIPYSLYEKLREKIEDELYLLQNKKALNKKSYEEFLNIEEVIEDMK